LASPPTAAPRKSLHITPDGADASRDQHGGGNGQPRSRPTGGKTVRTLYACVAEHETELSFEPNQVITSGKNIRVPFVVSIPLSS